jgi:hypothetical protein
MPITINLPAREGESIADIATAEAEAIAAVVAQGVTSVAAVAAAVASEVDDSATGPSGDLYVAVEAGVDSIEAAAAVILAPTTGTLDVAEAAAIAAVAAQGVTSVTAVETAESDALTAIAAVGTTTGTYGTIALGLTAASSGQEFQVLQSGGKAVDLFEDSSGLASFKGTAPIGDGIGLGQARVEGRRLTMATRPTIEGDVVGAAFTNGRIVPNRWSQRPSRNMVNKQAFLRDPLVTPNYSGDFHRVVLPTSGDILLFGTPANGALQRLKVIMKSTPGAGNQTVSIGLWPSDQAAVAITEGAETTYEANHTGNGSRQWAIGVGPEDILIKFCPQVYEKDETPETASAEAPATFSIQGATLSPSGTFTFTDGLIAGGTPRRLELTDAGGNYSMASGTILMAIRKDGAVGGDGAFGGVLFTPNLGNTTYDTITFGCAGVDLITAVPGCGGATATLKGDIVGEDFVVIAGTFDATTSTVYFEGIEHATGTGTGGTALSFPNFRLGAGYQDSRAWSGAYLPPRIWMGEVLSASQIAVETARARADLALLGAAWENRRFFAFGYGDSIMRGFLDAGGSANSYLDQSCQAISPKLKFRNSSVAGSNVATSTSPLNYKDSLRTTALRRVAQAVANGIKPIVVFAHGQNEPNDSTITRTQTEVDLLRAAGAIVIVCTQTSNNDTTYRPARTTALRDWVTAQDAASLTAGTAKTLYLCDFAANATMGADGAYLSSTYFGTGGVHPKQAGHDVMKTVLDPVLTTIYAEH